jgi:hypothetical protein
LSSLHTMLSVSGGGASTVRWAAPPSSSAIPRCCCRLSGGALGAGLLCSARSFARDVIVVMPPAGESRQFLGLAQPRVTLPIVLAILIFLANQKK